MPGSSPSVTAYTTTSIYAGTYNVTMTGTLSATGSSVQASTAVSFSLVIVEVCFTTVITPSS